MNLQIRLSRSVYRRAPLAVGVLLLATVEDQLNALWRVTTPRPWIQRILAYWTLLTLGPLLLGP